MSDELYALPKAGKPGPRTTELIPDPPSKCLTIDCNQEAFILFLVVRDRNNRTLTDIPSAFLTDSKSGELRHGYSFVTWIGRCEWCYTENLKKTGKSQSPVFQRKSEVKHD